MEKKEIKGHDFSEEIKRQVIENPDTKIIWNDRSYHISYGTFEEAYLPKYSAYCLVIENEQIVRAVMAGGASKKGSEMGLGQDINKLIEMRGEEDGGVTWKK